VRVFRPARVKYLPAIGESRNLVAEGLEWPSRNLQDYAASDLWGYYTEPERIQKGTTQKPAPTPKETAVHTRPKPPSGGGGGGPPPPHGGGGGGGGGNSQSGGGGGGGKKKRKKKKKKRGRGGSGKQRPD
jgi:hypothetical protein